MGRVLILEDIVLKGSRLKRIERLLEELLEQGSRIMPAIDDIKAAIADLQAEQQAAADAQAAESAETLTALAEIDTLVAQIVAAPSGTPDSELNAMKDQITAITSTVKDTVTSAAANTQAIADKLASIVVPTPTPTAAQSAAAAGGPNPGDPTQVASTKG